MRKATLFIWASLAISTAGWGEQNARGGMVTAQLANPLMMLPGMRPAPAVIPSGAIGSPMSATIGTAALPLPLVSEFSNAPNPFDSRQGSTTIGYLLAQDSRTTLTIYDLLGKKVLTWNFSAGQNGGKAGANTLPWDGTNETGRKVSKGGYIVELAIESPQGSATALRKIGVIH